MLSEEALYLKNCLISTKGEKGSITVAAAIVLCSVIVLNVVLYDYAKMKAVVSCIPERMRLAGKSVLASYDALLALINADCTDLIQAPGTLRIRLF